MPPLQILDTLPPLKERFQFLTSPVHEMLVSLHVLRHPDDHPHLSDWVHRTYPRLSTAQVAILDSFYTRFYDGVGLAEIAEGYDNPDDVEGFLRYVEGLSDAKFLWYLLGRANLEKEIVDTLAGHITLPDLIARNEYITTEQVKEFEPLFADPAGSQEQLLNLWRSYWHEIFAAEGQNYRAGWEQSLAIVQARLRQLDVLAFLEEVGICGSSREFLAETNIPEIRLIPSYFRTTKPLSLYTDDRMTILYNARVSVQRHADLEHKLDDVLTLSKALNDRTRLKLLGYLCRNEGEETGVALAGTLGISQPTVSRHLRILREAGILNEQRVGNRIHHTVNFNRITGLSDTIMSYLTD